MKLKSLTLFRLWNNQNWFRQTSTPHPHPEKKSSDLHESQGWSRAGLGGTCPPWLCHWNQVYACIQYLKIFSVFETENKKMKNSGMIIIHIVCRYIQKVKRTVCCSTTLEIDEREWVSIFCEDSDVVWARQRDTGDSLPSVESRITDCRSGCQQSNTTRMYELTNATGMSKFIQTEFQKDLIIRCTSSTFILHHQFNIAFFLVAWELGIVNILVLWRLARFENNLPLGRKLQ